MLAGISKRLPQCRQRRFRRRPDSSKTTTERKPGRADRNLVVRSWAPAARRWCQTAMGTDLSGKALW